MSNTDPEPLYSGNAGHGSRPLDILDPQTSSASLSSHPAASLRDFVSPPPPEGPLSHTSVTPPPGLAGHGSRGPQEGLDADHLRAKSVRDIVPEGEGRKAGKEVRYIAKGEGREGKKDGEGEKTVE